MSYKTPRRNYDGNLAALKRAGTSVRMAGLILDALSRLRFNVFRIHASGEFFSETYARAWALTCREYPKVKFWAYTRCWKPRILRVLREIPNLNLLLSLDRDNWKRMLRVSDQFPQFRLCYYSVGEPPPSEVYTRAAQVPWGSPKGLVVFPDAKVQRVSAFGGTCPTERASNRWVKDEACVKCRRCFARRPDEIQVQSG